MNNISFDNPWLLFLLIPFLAAVIIPFVITVRRDNANFHNITSAVLHVIICVCLTLTISGMSLETVVTETNVYVLADVSYSASHNLEEVQNNINAIAGKLPKNSKMGVIAFGRDYGLISELGDENIPNILTSEKVEEIDKSATDIAAALRYAGNLFDDDVIKRIIVITDGAETVTTGNILKVVSNLQDTGVYVDAVYLDDNITPSTREIQIDGVEATSSTFVDKQEEASVFVRASCGENEEGKANAKTDGYVTLYRNGEQIAETTAIFYSGLTVVNVPLPTDEAGSFTYDVKIRPAIGSNDFLTENNSYTFSQTISNDRKVLFIGKTDADVSAGRRIYGNEGVTYVTNPRDVPFSVEELCVFDEIALSNFDVREIAASRMFLASLTTLVDSYGKTITTYGNTYIQENTDGSDEVLNKYAGLLPVNVGNVNQNKRLVTILIDISRSINTQSRMVVAKRAAIELLNVLTPNDRVMVMGYAGKVKPLLGATELTAVSAIIEAINKVTPENNTNFVNAFEETYAAIQKEDGYAHKQLFLISDGLETVEDEDDAVTLAEEMSGSGIVISALGIYPDSKGDSFLNRIVNNPYSEGGFYKAISGEYDIDVTLKDIIEEEQEVIISGDNYKVKVDTADGVVEGLTDFGSIGGFYYNSAKSSATVVLTAEYERDRRNKFDVPIYAYWSGGGNGKVVSFMSDIAGGNWLSGWSDGTDGDKFLSNIPDATLPDERFTAPFLIDLNSDGSQVTVRVSSSLPVQAKADFKVTMTSPDEKITEKNLSFDSSSYLALFDTDAVGLYTLHVEYTFADVHYEADSSFTIAYFAEYDSFATYSKSSLYRLVTEYGGILDLEETQTLENTYSSYTTYVFDFALPLLIVCAVLFIADIVIRQLKWKDVTSFFGGMFRRRK